MEMTWQWVWLSLSLSHSNFLSRPFSLSLLSVGSHMFFSPKKHERNKSSGSLFLLHLICYWERNQAEKERVREEERVRGEERVREEEREKKLHSSYCPLFFINEKKEIFHFNLASSDVAFSSLFLSLPLSLTHAQMLPLSLSFTQKVFFSQASKQATICRSSKEGGNSKLKEVRR